MKETYLHLLPCHSTTTVYSIVLAIHFIASRRVSSETPFTARDPQNEDDTLPGIRRNQRSENGIEVQREGKDGFSRDERNVPSYAPIP